MEEEWLFDAQQQMLWDRYLSQRPRCCVCGQSITADHALQLDTGLLCPDCQERQVVYLDL